MSLKCSSGEGRDRHPQVIHTRSNVIEMQLIWRKTRHWYEDTKASKKEGGMSQLLIWDWKSQVLLCCPWSPAAVSGAVLSTGYSSNLSIESATSYCRCQDLNLMSNPRNSHEDVTGTAHIFQTRHVFQKEVEVPHSGNMMRSLGDCHDSNTVLYSSNILFVYNLHQKAYFYVFSIWTPFHVSALVFFVFFLIIYFLRAGDSNHVWGQGVTLWTQWHFSTFSHVL